MDELNKKTERSRELRNHMSPPEVILWNAIKANRFGFVVNRQKPFGPYFLDFYIARLKLAIEVDGKIHRDTFERDDRRDKWLESKGVTVIRISAQSIFENLGDVVEYLEIRVNELAEQKGKTPGRKSKH